MLFVITYLVSVWYIQRYALKIKRDPSKGFFPIGKYDKLDDTANVQLNTTHMIVLGCFLLNFVVLIFGVIKFSWYITEIAGIFTLLAIVIAFAGKFLQTKQ